MTDKKASEAKGPYFEKEDYSVHSMNTAYAEGFKAGRSSSDGLREALISISRNTCCEQCQQAKLVALAALEADGEVVE